jgi:NTE family protein
MHHDTHVPLAGAFGGGGLFGIGYAMGVIDGLREQGIDLSTAPMIGTSAGSWAAAATALGVGFDQLAALDVPRFPDPRSGVLANSARRVFGNAMRGNVRAIACALPRLRRTELDGAKFPLSTIVAASSAVPGLLAPQRIEGRWYIDGGVRSGVSVDLAAPADLLIVIAPLAGAMFGPFNNLVERNTDREIAAWRKSCRGNVRLFAPTATTAKIATLPHHLFDKDRAIDAYARGRQEARGDLVGNN